MKRDEEQLLREAVDDFLYVLALLVLSPLLIARWAWRKLLWLMATL